ncbi:hypothetical protein ACTD5D_40510 [Nocardia takedensis]|uniref:hypothetical protein n=1 Tax=Nocardia takedensis TaxID=259390 RepID=UPI003F772BDF
MVLDVDEFRCTDVPRWMSLRDAREVVRTHRSCGCGLGVVAVMLLDGAHHGCWPDADSLRTPQEWVHAYAARNLAASVDGDARVGLVADDTVSAVSMPPDIAARVYDRLESPAATLVPATRQLCTADWFVLVRPDAIAAQAMAELAELGVRVLPPGERLDLPMTARPGEAGRRWWMQWPRLDPVTRDTVATPDLMAVLNLCLDAAHSTHWLVRATSRRGEQLALEPRARLTVSVDAAAAAEICQYTESASPDEAASALIVLGARLHAAAGSGGPVRIRDPQGFETVVTLDDLPEHCDGGIHR